RRAPDGRARLGPGGRCGGRLGSRTGLRGGSDTVRMRHKGASMPSYSLSILRHDQSSDLFTFDQAKVLIGRESGDVVTRDPKTSGRHGELTFEGGVLRFTDLNSTNGTYRVSGERVVGTIVLTPGTALRIGDTTIAVQAIDSGLGFGPGGTQVMQAPPAAAFADTALATAPAALGQLAPEAPAPPAPGPVAAAPQGAPAPAPQPAPAAAWSGQAASDAFGGAPAAGAPVGQPSPAPSPHPLAAPAPAYAAPPLAGSGDGLFDQFKAFLSNAVETYKTQAVDGALTMGLVMLPGAVVGVATGWIPIVGWILGVLVALVELAMAPIAAGAMWRWSLAAASGERLTWKQAWGAALKSPVSEWLNIAVMSLDRKSTRLNSSHVKISYAAFCLKKKSTQVHGNNQHIQCVMVCHSDTS